MDKEGVMPKARFWSAGAVEGQITDENEWSAIGWAKGHGNVQIGVGCGGEFESTDPEKSHWMTLDDRSAVNRFIRELRHARDQAFGKDE